MVTSEKSTLVSLTAINNDTGETTPIQGYTVEKKKYFNIKNLNKRIAIMDLFTAQAIVCNSSKSIEIFRDILFATNKENIFQENITKYSKKIGCSRQQLTALLGKFVKNNIAIRIDKGKYLINPFMFQSKGSTNELIENAQFEWSNMMIIKREKEFNNELKKNTRSLRTL